ncbi:conserved hypothetical protein [Hyella patelloides LEGE 07179]|uniref:Uncharacterized protein n=1 Tax=Hyella patelloides LEGE 07179 TaxID=945734 RepID=A0A563VK06_9CYAN|nr:hypothetical protein [Hyella patelloides]VEP11800.1 conserved hypothetical protein [Hyella patelloides LEGE 07179]
MQLEYDKNGLNEELTLLLESEHSLQKFIDKLQYIKNLYSELCYLFQVSDNEYPLKIVKMESGSLFAKVFGEAKVIKTLSIWIENTVSYFHRNYTNEGQIKSITHKLEVIENLLETTKKLEEAGIDTTKNKEALQKSSLIIARELNLLLGGEPCITINDHKHSITAELQQKYLEESKTHFLIASQEESEDND